MSQPPDLSSAYPLAPQQVTHYREKGWVLLREVAAPAEIAAYRPIIGEVTMAHNANTKPLAQRDTYGKAFIQVINMWEMDARVKQFSFAKRFAKIAAELMGVSGVRMYHDQALYKEAGGGYTPWHQDQQYWPLDGMKCVTLWMPLVDATTDMGTMRFATGSQSLGYLGPLSISDDSEAKLEAFIAGKGFSVEAAGAMRAGDATFHDGWTIHGAPGNQSQTTTREVMTVIYVEENATTSGERGDRWEGEFQRFFPGCERGGQAASELNPVLYRAD